MTTNLEIFESVLESAAEKLGDITQPVMNLYYQRFPEAKAAFMHHGFDNTKSLEAAMVETVVYLLMTWFERQVEIEIILRETVPHHVQILNIPLSIFAGLVDCTLDVMESAIPAGNHQQLGICEELRQGLLGFIDRSAPQGRK